MTWRRILERQVFEGRGSIGWRVVALGDSGCRNDASIESWQGRGCKDFVRREKVIHVVVCAGGAGRIRRRREERERERGTSAWGPLNFLHTR